MADSLRKFGKYFLLDLLAQGGMAEIYRARQAALDGGNRILAIKRILKSYSENSEFVAMFRSEIKTTSGFTHPNIVQVYDYGEEDGMLYIAMEWVDGKNLRQFISKFGELKTTFPLEVSCYLVEQAARALAYAHSYKDRFSGKSLNIVHRDISPQNILISYDGAVKVIDFGIAKAVTNIEATRAGVIKGKPSYLSPEQIAGDSLDGRSDIFALGIVFWELLIGKKLFQGENDYAVLKLIENCGHTIKAPSLINPKIPKELDVIVMKCLAKNRDQRFSSADEMQRALHKFLYQYAADFNPTDLADYARDLFKNDIVEDRKRLLRLNDKVERLLQSYEQIQVKEQEEATNTSTTRKVLEKTINDDPNPTEPDVKKPTEERGTGSFRVVDFKEKQSSYSVEVDKVGQRASGPIEFAQVASTQVASGTKMWKSAGNGGSKRGRLHFATFGGLVLFIGAAAFIINAYFKSFPSGTSGGKATVRIEGNVPAATVMINGRQVADKLPATVGGLAAGEAEVTVFASGYRRETRKINLNDGEQQSVRVQLTREDSSDIATRTGREAGLAKSTVLRVNVTPAGEAPRIKVNGQLLDISGVSAAPVGVPLEITVERPGFAVFRKKIEIPATTQDEYVLDVVLREAKFGFLSIKTTPSAEALITVDGIEEKLSTPFVRKKLPVGEYQVKLVNTVLGLEKIVSVRIEEDRFSNLEERFYDEPSGRMPSMSR